MPTDEIFEVMEAPTRDAVIKVIGVGGGGSCSAPTSTATSSSCGCC